VTNVVTFGRRPVPEQRLAVAERLLSFFNEKADTSYGSFTGSGKPSESLKRIIGALTDHPNLDEGEAERIIAWRLSEPFWDGKPDTGVVFGPGVFEKNRESARAPQRRDRPATSREIVDAQRRFDAEKQARQAARADVEAS
jgi:hypothetical protein